MVHWCQDQPTKSPFFYYTVFEVSPAYYYTVQPGRSNHYAMAALRADKRCQVSADRATSCTTSGHA